MSSNKYLIVFDTNVLHINYDKKTDFTKFYFNATFNNIADKIEQLDIYQYVSIAIPTVVWEEMKEQKVKAYIEKLEQAAKSVEKNTFPFHVWKQADGDCIYENYLEERIEEYRSELDDRQVPILELGLPTRNRFESIVERAFQKRPPFEGKTSKSDKGFKDALLWESILEYKNNNLDTDIFLYSKDAMFNSELEEEYTKTFEGSKIKIFKDNCEKELIKELESIALAIDKLTYIPQEIEENSEIKSWIYSEDFQEQIKSHSIEFFGESKYLTLERVEIKDIIEIVSEQPDDISVDYTVDLELKIFIGTKNDNVITDEMTVSIGIESVDEAVFTLDYVQIWEEGEEDE